MTTRAQQRRRRVLDRQVERARPPAVPWPALSADYLALLAEQEHHKAVRRRRVEATRRRRKLHVLAFAVALTSITLAYLIGALL